MASKFINKVTATDHPLEAGAGLRPCTKHIQYIPYTPEPGSDRRMIFIDTPGFPDPEPKKTRTQQEEIARIESVIAEWLVKSSRERIQVNGILYLYKLDQNRMTDRPRLNFELFKKLWGNDYTGRVLLVATMSEKVKEAVVRKNRKAELMEHWGGIVVEHDGTMESARRIVNALFDQPSQAL